MHDNDYDSVGESIILTDDGLFTNTSATYTLTLYPTSAFFEVYSTRNPVIATVGAVCIIIFTSISFLLYDTIVRKEVHNKEAVLEAKKRFVRFGMSLCISVDV